jgi:hypothetical protein
MKTNIKQNNINNKLIGKKILSDMTLELIL